jgi:hypothetical protein
MRLKRIAAISMTMTPANIVKPAQAEDITCGSDCAQSPGAQMLNFQAVA